MGKKRRVDKDPFVFQHILEILVWLPVVSLLRFKLVCKSWCAFIQTLIDPHTTTTSKFGSFILHAAVVDFQKRFRENALLMLSPSVSESECCVVSTRPGSWYSGSCGSWSTTAYYGICGGCDSGSSYSGITYCSANCCEKRKWGPYTYNDDDDDDDLKQLVIKLDNLGFPSCYQFDRMIINKPPKVMVVGSCNGLICLYAEQPNLLQVSLWNPATKQFRILPKPITCRFPSGNGKVHRLFAFGHDAETKDYKVVLLSVVNRRMLNHEIGGPIAMECLCRVQVYSQSSNSWRLLEGITSLPASPYPSDSSELFYQNGCCLFMAKLLYSESSPPCPPKLKDRFIISLDLTQQIITTIKLPFHHPLERLYLCYFGKKIAVFAKIYFYARVYDDDDVNDPKGSWEEFCVSVVNEHTSSWTVVHRFRIRLGLPGERNIPRGISNDGVFALLETEISGGKKKMKLYNLVTNQVKKNFLYCDQVLSRAYAYNPSLVSITGGASASASANGRVIGGEAAATTEMDWK